MALINCKECGAQVSTQAKNCPSCGAKVKKPTSTFVWVILGLMVFGIIGTMVGGTNTSSQPNNNDNVESDVEMPKGIHYEGQTTDPTVKGMIFLVKEKLIKDAINPESVQFQNVFYANQNNMVAVCGEINVVKTAGQSGFKRFISNGMEATAIDGHSKNFNKLWNQVCKH